MSKLSYLWPAWILFTVAATIAPFQWHLEYFRRPGGPFLPLYLGLLAALGVAAFLYIRLRQARPALLAWEPRLFAGFFLVFFLFYAPLPTLYAIWILLICFSLGRLALGRLAEGPLDSLVVWPAAGLGFLSALLFALGLAGLYHRWTAFSLLALGALLTWRSVPVFWRLLRELNGAYARSAAGSVWGLCLVVVFVFALCAAMVVLSPETAFDPVAFHFPLAREYAAQHRLVAIPRLPYSYFPQNVEVLYTLGFLLEGQATAKILTGAFYPLAALSLVLIGRRWFSAAGGLLGAALFVTTPFIAWTGSVAKNDMALTLYLLLALYGVLRWVDENRFGWLAAAALFLGFAFGVKHVALLGAVPLVLLAAWNVRRARLGLRQGLAVAAIFVASGLYWHARAWTLAGHPLYPEVGSSAVTSKTAAGHPKLSRLERAAIYVSTPWRIHFRGLHAFESPSPNPAGFAVLAFLPLLFRRGGVATRGARLALLFGALYFFYWAAILIKVRYAMAVFGVLFVCLGDRLCSTRRLPALALAGWCFAFSLTATLILQLNVPRLKLFARRINAEQFLRESLITYRSIEALSRHARPGQLAYSVGNCSTFYAAVEFHCYYDDRNNYALGEISRALRDIHYQYLIVPAGWAEPRHLHVVEAYYHPVPLYRDESFRLYRLYRFR